MNNLILLWHVACIPEGQENSIVSWPELKAEGGDNKVKKKSIVVLMGIIGLLSFIPVQSSFGGTCGVSSCTLDVWNTQALQDSGDTITVTLNDAANTLTFTFNDFAGLPDPDYKLMKTIGWNGLVDGTGNTGFHLSADGNLDGFGFFNTVYDKNTPIGSGPFPTSFTFGGITNTSLVGSTFAVHVIYSSATSCSGWVGNGTTSGGGDGSGCGSVPEPASLFLLGVGLAGVGIWQWAKRKSFQA